MNIPKHVIDQKIHTKINFFDVKWTPKDKIYDNHVNSIFFNFYFDTTLMYFLNPHFSFSLCDNRSVVISKVHYESIIFLEFIQKFYDDSH
jgi:hypothetical protein